MSTTQPEALDELMERLRKLAANATPGPWQSISRASYWGEEEGDVDTLDGHEILGAEFVKPLDRQETTRGQAWLRDTDYIAAAHPQAVIALLDRIAELEAQLEAIGAGGVSPLMAGAAGWQPIETAPKDGAEILGYTAEAGNLVLYWDTIGREPAHWSDGMSIYNREPTHWQPLPAAPSISGETK